MDIKIYPAKDGFRWWLDSWNLISTHILFCLGMLVLFIIPSFLGQLPYVGGALESVLIFPLQLGSLAVLHEWRQGRAPSFLRLFSAFFEKGVAVRLLALWLCVILLGMLADGLMVAEQSLSNPTFFEKSMFKFSMSPVSLLFYWWVLTAYACQFLLMQLFMPLQYFQQRTFGEAWSLGVRACKANWRPLLVNAVAGIALMGVAALPMGLGLLLFLPAMLALPYILYEELFTK